MPVGAHFSLPFEETTTRLGQAQYAVKSVLSLFRHGAACYSSIVLLVCLNACGSCPCFTSRSASLTLYKRAKATTESFSRRDSHMIILEWFLPFVRSYAPRHRAWVAALFWTAVALWIISFATIGGMGIIDDEGSYIPAAEAIGAFLRGEIDLAAMLEKVVRYGWFMPGTPLLFTPIFLGGNPGTFVVRLYAGFLVLALWIWTQREVNRALGPVYVIFLLAFPTLMLTWQFFAKTALADLPAGLVMTVAFCRLFTITRTILAGRDLRSFDFAVFELVLVLMVYLRGSTWVLVAAIHLFLAAIALIASNRTMLLAAFTKIGAGFVLFAALLAPWSLLVSSYFGAPVLTTTTTMLSLGVTFGNINKLCFGPCPEGNLWFEAGKFSREISRERGISELAVQREMARSAIGAFDPRRYLRVVKSNFRRFLMNPNDFNRFFINRRLNGKSYYNRKFALFLRSISSIELYILYYPALLALLVGNLCVAVRRESDQIMSLMIKMFTLCFLIQPFVHLSHSRYWPTFAPLMSLSAAAIFVWAWAKFAKSVSAEKGAIHALSSIHDANPARGRKVLVSLQTLYVALLTISATVIFFA